MIPSLLAALATRFVAELQRHADAEQQRLHLLVTQPILRKINAMSEHLNSVVADLGAKVDALTAAEAAMKERVIAQNTSTLVELADLRAKIVALDTTGAEATLVALTAKVEAATADMQGVDAPADPVPPVADPVAGLPAPADPAAVGADPAAPASEAPPATDANVAPGSSLFSDPTQTVPADPNAPVV